MAKKYQSGSWWMAALSIGLCLDVASGQQPEFPRRSPSASESPGVPILTAAPGRPDDDEPTIPSSATQDAKAKDVTDSGKTPIPDREPTLKIFVLENADATDCARILNELSFRFITKIVADPRKNSLIVESWETQELRKMEAILQMLDETPTKARRVTERTESDSPPTSARLSSDTDRGQNVNSSVMVDVGDKREARKRIEQLLQKEAKAAELAEQIRIRSKEEGIEPSQLDQIRRELHETLTGAIAVKFQLEQMQLNALEERIVRLKTQIARRTASVKQIVERRARELIEGDASRWTPNEPDATQTSTTKAAETKQSAVVEPAEANTVSRQDSPVASKGQRMPADTEDRHSGLSSAQVPFSSYQDFASKLSTMNRDVRQAEEQLRRMTLAAQAGGATKVELLKASNHVEDAIRNRKLIQEEYAATMKDLALQVEGARADLENAQESYDRLVKSGVVPERAIIEAKSALVRAKTPLERLKLRYELYQKAGDGLKPNVGSEAPLPSDDGR